MQSWVPACNFDKEIDIASELFLVQFPLSLITTNGFRVPEWNECKLYTSVTAFITYFLPHFWKLSVRCLKDLLINSWYLSQIAGRPSFIVPITAGIGIVPASWVPGYSVSKAALHSFSLSREFNSRPKKVRSMSWKLSHRKFWCFYPLVHISLFYRLVESELHDGKYLYPMLWGIMEVDSRFIPDAGTTEKLDKF